MPLHTPSSTLKIAVQTACALCGGFSGVQIAVPLVSYRALAFYAIRPHLLWRGFDLIFHARNCSARCKIRNVVRSCEIL